jgi:hypothetical protein
MQRERHQDRPLIADTESSFAIAATAALRQTALRLLEMRAAGLPSRWAAEPLGCRADQPEHRPLFFQGKASVTRTW